MQWCPHSCSSDVCICHGDQREAKLFRESAGTVDGDADGDSDSDSNRHSDNGCGSDRARQPQRRQQERSARWALSWNGRQGDTGPVPNLAVDGERMLESVPREFIY